MMGSCINTPHAIPPSRDYETRQLQQTNMRLAALLALPAASRLACAIELDLNDQESIKSVARTTADTMMRWYFGNTTRPYAIPGLLPGPYYWWEAGAMFGSLIDYWYYTGDPSYNEVTTQALLHQVSRNHSNTEAAV